jgi:hypothetical protein
MPKIACGACEVDRRGVSPGEAFVGGLIVAGLEQKGLANYHQLCPRHASLQQSALYKAEREGVPVGGPGATCSPCVGGPRDDGPGA